MARQWQKKLALIQTMKVIPTLNHFFLAMSFLLALGLMGCGANSAPLAAPPASPSVESKLVNWKNHSLRPLDDSLQISDSAISGQGRIQFENEFDLDRAYTLSFSLQDKGTLTLITNSDETFSSGLKLTLTRVGNSLRLEMATSTMNYRFIPEDVTHELISLGLDPTKQLQLTFDVHAHGHFKMMTPKLKTKDISFTEMSGKRLGIILDSAILNKVKIGPASVHKKRKGL